MTEIATAPESTATQEVERWLAAFETALADRDAAAAAALFATDSYWRDLVAFTWNLKTVEGREGVADLVEHTAEQTGAHGFHVTEPAAEA
ncbi:MAG: NAD(P)/FAD-dependent oxidoreductase, partial [Gaiellaceae bacterium]